MLEPLFPAPPAKRGRGMPPVPRRHALNTILYVGITGCRWCDVPRTGPFASK
ncbi:transposase, partial [Candidatus Parcubacteria bacterium]